MNNALNILVGLSLVFTSCDEEETVKIAANLAVVTNLNNDLMLKVVNHKKVVGCTCGITVMPPMLSLTWNNLLAPATSAHSKDMAANNFFAHESSTVKIIINRLALLGYNSG